MTETSDVETFDVDAWAEGATRVTHSVDVYGKPSLATEIKALDVRLRAADGADAVALAEQIEAKRAEMEASLRTFVFQSLSPKEIDAVTEAMKGRTGEDADYEEGMRFIAAQCIEPKGVTWETLAKMHDRLGGYFNTTVVRAARLARDGVEVTVPFSLNASHILATRG